MKKLLISFFVLALLVSAVPTGTASAAPAKPVLVVTPPTEGFQGDEFVFTVMVTNLPKAKVTKANYQIQIYKQAVDTAWIATLNGQGAVIEDLGEFYQITWSKLVKKNKGDTFAAFEVGLKLSSVNSGPSMSLLQVIDGNNVTVKLVDIKLAEIVWTISAPTIVKENSNFDFYLRARNDSSIALDYKFSMDVWHTCLRSNPTVIVPEGAALYDFKADRWHEIQYWTGTVAPHSTAEWKYGMLTSYTLSQCGIVEWVDLMNFGTSQIVRLDVIR